jgi:hypothetical protein
MDDTTPKNQGEVDGIVMPAMVVVSSMKVAAPASARHGKIFQRSLKYHLRHARYFDNH